MNLLPKSRAEFGEVNYWDKFFSQRRKAFDWYGEYPELCGHLHKYIRPKDEVLMLGCGNSTLSADLYDVGYRKLTNIDISDVVIKQMVKLHEKDRPALLFHQMDATALIYSDQSFTVALDKGTLDALMPDEEKGTLATVDKYFNEVARVLRDGGRYVCVSLLQPHILRKVLDFFPANNFLLRIVRCHEAEAKTKADNPDGLAMPVFLVVATKFSKLPMQVLEANLVGDVIQRLSSSEELYEAINSAQSAALRCSNLNKNDKAALDDEVRIDLIDPKGKQPRYTIVVVDQERKKGFGAFIVPQGKECEWMFSTKEGRRKMLKTTGYGRLAFVLLHRDNAYESLAVIQDELSGHIQNLAPNNLGKDEKIPFLTIGDDLGERTVIHRGNSKFSGDYVIEEVVTQSGDTFRRLIFLDNQFVIQSEALLKTSTKKKKKNDKKVVDLTYLACQHHLFMIFGTVAATKARNDGNVLVVGLGGGGLCTSIQQVAPSVKITAVDIDPAIAVIAKDFFGLQSSDRMDVQIQDGLVFLETAKMENKRFDAILFDVDSKDPSLGMSCPPKQFVEEETLANVKECLKDDGLFVLNLVCRDDDLKEQILKTLCNAFGTVYSYKVEDEVNEIVYCSKSQKADLKKVLREAIVLVNGCIKEKKLDVGEELEVDELEKSLKRLKM